MMIDGTILILITTVVVAFITCLIRSDLWRDEAVERGHAEYYLTAWHDKRWRWRKPGACQKPASVPEDEA